MPYTLRKAVNADIPALCAMARCIWQTVTADDFLPLMEQEDQSVFLICAEGVPCGFAQCGLRYDYVEGTHSSPVGYLEGIYVVPEHRGAGCGSRLLEACEDWAAAAGCSEFASDCEMDNTQSLQFHLHTGFSEANRIICFAKKLSPQSWR